MIHVTGSSLGAACREVRSSYLPSRRLPLLGSLLLRLSTHTLPSCVASLLCAHQLETFRLRWAHGVIRRIGVNLVLWGRSEWRRSWHLVLARKGTRTSERNVILQRYVTRPLLPGLMEILDNALQVEKLASAWVSSWL